MDGGENLSKTMQHPLDGPRTPKEMYLKINTCLKWAEQCSKYLNLAQIFGNEPLFIGPEQPFRLNRVR